MGNLFASNPGYAPILFASNPGYAPIPQQVSPPPGPPSICMEPGELLPFTSRGLNLDGVWKVHVISVYMKNCNVIQLWAQYANHKDVVFSVPYIKDENPLHEKLVHIVDLIHNRLVEKNTDPGVVFIKAPKNQTFLLSLKDFLHAECCFDNDRNMIAVRITCAKEYFDVTCGWVPALDGKGSCSSGTMFKDLIDTQEAIFKAVDHYRASLLAKKEKALLEAKIDSCADDDYFAPPRA